MATGRLSLVSSARNTVPMPPSPSLAWIRYGPISAPITPGSNFLMILGWGSHSWLPARLKSAWWDQWRSHKPTEKPAADDSPDLVVHRNEEGPDRGASRP